MELRADALQLAYPASAGQVKRPVLSGVDFQLDLGRFQALAGPNGAGKSTLMRALAGLHEPESGRVLLDGEPLESRSMAERAQIIGYLPQEIQPHFHFSVRDCVLLGVRVQEQSPWFESQPSATALAAIDRALALVDAIDLRERQLHELSGGERRRVLLASVLAQEPRFLLLDEPAAMLDLSHQAALFALLKRLTQEQGLGVLCVSHDWNLASTFADHLTILHDAGVHASGSPAELMTEKVLTPLFGNSYTLLPRPGHPPVLLPQ